MGRFSSVPSRRRHLGRTRRRAFFIAEVLETRQLLSVAAAHPSVVPLPNVPAVVGPAVPSPVTPVGLAGSTGGTPQQVIIVFQVTQGSSNAGAGNGVAQGLFAVEEIFSGGSISGGNNATSPTPASATSTEGASAASSAAASSSITPLTAVILAGPSGASRAPIIVIVQPQPLLVNLGPSSISVTTQAILATATLEEQPIQPPVLGQGFESPVGQELDPPQMTTKGQTMPARIEFQLPATDYIEPFQPAPANPPPAAPARPVEPVEPQAAEPARRVTEPVEALAAPIHLTDWGKQPDLPLLTPRIEIRTNEEYPTWSLATAVGTAMVASGGYQLLFGGSARLNQRWNPERRSRRREGTGASEDSE